jgi:predicted transposase YdaD
MPHAFDPTLKYLVAFHPADWLKIAGISAEPAEVLEDIDEDHLLSADLSTVSAYADILIRLKGDGLAHIEFQTGPDVRMDDRTLRYNVLADYRYRLPVESVVILLRPEADHPAITGQVRRLDRTKSTYLDFRYRVMRIWQVPVDEVLNGPLGVLPIAPLANLGEAALPDVIRTMEERIRSEATTADAEEIWTSVYLLMGMRYTTALVIELLQGVMGMQESVTYQHILREGEAKGEARGEASGIRKTILRIGAHRFGPPTQEVMDRLEALDSVEALQAISDRFLEVETWDELLRQP